MSRIKLILSALLIATTVLADPTLWLPIAIPQAYWTNPTKKQQIKDAMCELAGVDKTDAGWQSVKQQANWTARTNVVGNAEVGVPAGSDWYINCDSVNNWFGKRSVERKRYVLTFNTNNLATNCAIETLSIDINQKATTLRALTNLFLVGEWNQRPATNFTDWGIVEQDQPE